MKIQISSTFGTVFLVIVGYLYLNHSSQSDPSEERDNKNVRECTWTLSSPCTAFSQSLSVSSLRLDPKAFRAVVQAKGIDREGLGKCHTGTRQRSTYIHVHFSRNMGNFEKIMISLLGWLVSRGIIEVKVTDNDKKNCTKFT